MTREQDARVAAALGWRRIEWEGGTTPMGRSPRNVLSLVLEEVPHYSTDLAAAWTLVEQCYSGCVERLSNGDVYEAYLVIERDGKNADSYASASTPAAAIVAAFLAAVEA